MGVEVRAKEDEDLVWILVGDEPEVELGGRLGREHGLRPWALVPGGDPGDVASGCEQELLDDVLGHRVANGTIEPHQLSARLGPRADLAPHLPVGAGGLDRPLYDAAT